MAINPPDLASTAGVPQQWSEDLNVTAEGFIVGDQPAVVTEDLIFAADQTIPARTPVGFNASGQLVPALLAAENGVAPIGFTVVAVTTPVGATKGAPVYRAGVFNPALADWPASFDTDAKKLNAFHGAPAPTNIVMRPVKTATPVLP